MTGLRARLIEMSVPGAKLGGAQYRDSLGLIGSGPSAPGPCGEVDPELFFPKHPQDVRHALTICGRCDYTSECAQLALGVPGKVSGIWAGIHIQTSAKNGRNEAMARIRRMAGEP